MSKLPVTAKYARQQNICLPNSQPATMVPCGIPRSGASGLRAPTSRLSGNISRLAPSIAAACPTQPAISKQAGTSELRKPTQVPQIVIRSGIQPPSGIAKKPTSHLRPPSGKFQIPESGLRQVTQAIEQSMKSPTRMVQNPTTYARLPVGTGLRQPSRLAQPSSNFTRPPPGTAQAYNYLLQTSSRSPEAGRSRIPTDSPRSPRSPRFQNISISPKFSRSSRSLNISVSSQTPPRPSFSPRPPSLSKPPQCEIAQKHSTSPRISLSTAQLEMPRTPAKRESPKMPGAPRLAGAPRSRISQGLSNYPQSRTSRGTCETLSTPYNLNKKKIMVNRYSNELAKLKNETKTQINLRNNLEPNIINEEVVVQPKKTVAQQILESVENEINNLYVNQNIDLIEPTLCTSSSNDENPEQEFQRNLDNDYLNQNIDLIEPDFCSLSSSNEENCNRNPAMKQFLNLNIDAIPHDCIEFASTDDSSSLSPTDLIDDLYDDEEMEHAIQELHRIIAGGSERLRVRDQSSRH